MIAEAAFANPFSDERLEIDRKISKSDHLLTREEIFQKLIPAVKKQIEILKKERRAEVKLYTGTDRLIITGVLLFEIFHNYIHRLDAFILKQLKNINASCHIDFIDSILKDFAEYGFTEDEACHYLALFYQLRRAYYFINSLLIGRSPAMKELRMHLWRNIFSYNLNWYDTHLNARMEDFSTLLIGETGTGKGLAAFAAGSSGFIPFDKGRNCFIENFTRAFISINLSQFSELLIESELFGHKKGAFTGAIESHQGALARSNQYGAVFLDEIGEVSLPIQIKLLKVLQERFFSPVGSHEKIRFNGRVIAATNRSQNELRDPKRFRQDFYFRLCSDVIELPPLRERLKDQPEELKELIDHILKNMTGKETAPEELSVFIRNSIKKHQGKNYEWPGNVRELEQCVRRILLKGKYNETIFKYENSENNNFLTAIQNCSLTADEILSKYSKLLFEKYKTIGAVAEIMKIDRRTAKKHLFY